MFKIKIEDRIFEKLSITLAEEDEGTCIRLKEYRVGGGWHAKIMLGLGMDEFDNDEDVSLTLQGIPFIADKGFLDKYGSSYILSINERNEIILSVEGTEWVLLIARWTDRLDK